jgi:hypothetical protein
MPSRISKSPSPGVAELVQAARDDDIPDINDCSRRTHDAFVPFRPEEWGRRTAETVELTLEARPGRCRAAGLRRCRCGGGGVSDRVRFNVDGRLGARRALARRQVRGPESVERPI